MASFNIKRNDTSPALRCALKPSNIDLTGATVIFNMQSSAKQPVIIAGGCTIESISPPVVVYQWQDGDTAIAGRFLGEFEVTYFGGAVETFPNEGFIPIEIEEDIA